MKLINKLRKRPIDIKRNMVEAVKNRAHDAEINAAAESSRKVGSQGHR